MYIEIHILYIYTRIHIHIYIPTYIHIHALFKMITFAYS